MIRYMAIVTIASLLSLAGCGSGDTVRKFHVSGNVTFKGSPVPSGTIIFDPDRASGNSAPQGVAEIIDGKFDTSKGEGVVGGAYQVIINGFNGKPDVTNESSEIKPLFPENKRKVDLPQKTTTMDFDIP